MLRQSSQRANYDALLNRLDNSGHQGWVKEAGLPPGLAWLRVDDVDRPGILLRVAAPERISLHTLPSCLPPSLLSLLQHPSSRKLEVLPVYLNLFKRDKPANRDFGQINVVRPAQEKDYRLRDIGRSDQRLVLYSLAHRGSLDQVGVDASGAEGMNVNVVWLDLDGQAAGKTKQAMLAGAIG